MRYLIFILTIGLIILAPKTGDSSTETIPYYMFRASQQFDVEVPLLYAFCHVESRCKQNALNKDDGRRESRAKGVKTHSHGLFQIQLPTARGLGFKGAKKDLMKPDVNTWYAAKLIRQLMDKYEDLPKVISAYNAGHPSRHNKKYVHLVMKAYINYQLDHIVTPKNIQE